MEDRRFACSSGFPHRRRVDWRRWKIWRGDWWTAICISNGGRWPIDEWLLWNKLPTGRPLLRSALENHSLFGKASWHYLMKCDQTIAKNGINIRTITHQSKKKSYICVGLLQTFRNLASGVEGGVGASLVSHLGPLVLFVYKLKVCLSCFITRA